MEKFTVVTGIAAPMMMPNINTDAISPMAAGRSTATDLGVMLFANWRYRLDGSEIGDFVLNREPFRRSKTIVAGENFGCGSSRERAVWALMRFGIRCVIAPSFADIFRENAFQNGLLPVVVGTQECASLAAALECAQEPLVTVDLERCVVQGPEGWTSSFVVPTERRTALLEGLDEIDVILRMAKDIDAFQRRDREQRPWIYLER
ncbi:MAG: 3-isopropylmalate dehydratase small subunit [Betaproteobacteria bacterium]|nr:3-isopropylmalate dehydratase small subunit [Betaproteobacteria bacterium]